MSDSVRAASRPPNTSGTAWTHKFASEVADINGITTKSCRVETIPPGAVNAAVQDRAAAATPMAVNSIAMARFRVRAFIWRVSNANTASSECNTQSNSFLRDRPLSHRPSFMQVQPFA